MDCIFCMIVAGEVPSTRVYDDDLVYAFRDINPAANTHVLIVPKEHIPSIADVREQDGPLLLRIMQVANQIARDENIDRTGYRIIANAGPDAGQTVYHVHFHLLGGNNLGALVGSRRP